MVHAWVDQKLVESIVGYHTNTGCLEGIGKLPALRGWYFGWYYLIYLAGTPIFLKKGAGMHRKGV
jgi:hypothetical protein